MQILFWLSSQSSYLLGDDCGIEILNDCRTGNCGSCTAKLLKGRVSMGNAHALADEERANGFILTCQAKPEIDVAVAS